MLSYPWCPVFLGLPCPCIHIKSYLCPVSMSMLHRSCQWVIGRKWKCEADDLGVTLVQVCVVSLIVLSF